MRDATSELMHVADDVTRFGSDEDGVAAYLEEMLRSGTE